MSNRRYKLTCTEVNERHMRFVVHDFRGAKCGDICVLTEDVAEFVANSWNGDVDWNGRMLGDRWKTLMDDDSLDLTEAEIAQGWHFCHEFDLLLRTNKEEEFQCTCIPVPPVDNPRPKGDNEA